jgi:hypothetical protein
MMMLMARGCTTTTTSSSSSNNNNNINYFHLSMDGFSFLFFFFSLQPSFLFIFLCIDLSLLKLLYYFHSVSSSNTMCICGRLSRTSFLSSLPFREFAFHRIVVAFFLHRTTTYKSRTFLEQHEMNNRMNRGGKLKTPQYGQRPRPVDRGRFFEGRREKWFNV